ncbi:hypothetical protein E2C01_003465 [Portunus trituberculatus]|uniref:Uncharacterized protein n=1 Tax=Portunus trituberculatus TaxID=210409 RepID=A0A5B7CMA3_PORTR|nr:hypothetical protein [Portunus trituberculatus]
MSLRCVSASGTDVCGASDQHLLIGGGEGTGPASTPRDVMPGNHPSNVSDVPPRPRYRADDRGGSSHYARYKINMIGKDESSSGGSSTTTITTTAINITIITINNNDDEDISEVKSQYSIKTHAFPSTTCQGLGLPVP